jgi:hypothetical protein
MQSKLFEEKVNKENLGIVVLTLPHKFNDPTGCRRKSYTCLRVAASAKAGR